MSSYSGQLRQLIDPSLHNDDHNSLVDRMGQEFCIECSLNDLSSKSAAILHKTHVCHCLAQLLPAGREFECLSHLVFPAIVHCIGDLENANSPSVSKLKECLILLAESVLVNLKSSQVHCFISMIVDRVTTDGCSKQPNLISLLGRLAKTAQTQCESNSFINILCVKFRSFMERLIRSSLVSSTPSLVCDVFFLFTLGATDPVVARLPPEPIHQQQFQQSAEIVLSESCLVIFQSMYKVMNVLVECVEKLGHEGCWTNFLVLLLHLSNAVEASVLDDQGFFDTLINGSSNEVFPDGSLGSNISKGLNTKNEQAVRLGVCARSQLAQSTCPTSCCAAAKLFSSLCRQRTVFARQLLRDGIGEFAIAGLNIQGVASAALIKEALSQLLDDLSREEPIAFFHPSHFHPFALDAMLEVIGLNDAECSSLIHTSDPMDENVIKWENISFASEHGADDLKFSGPLALVLLRCSQHSSVIDNVGVGGAIRAVSRAALANLSAGIGSEQCLQSCLIALIGLIEVQDSSIAHVDGIVSLLVSSLFTSEMIGLESIVISSLDLVCLWLQHQSTARQTTAEEGVMEVSWIADVIFGNNSRFVWSETTSLSFPKFASLVSCLVEDTPSSLKDIDASSLAEYVCKNGFLVSSLSSLVDIQMNRNQQGVCDSQTVDKNEMSLIRGFGAVAGRLVGFKFPITDGLVSLSESTALNQNENNSLQNIMFQLISDSSSTPRVNEDRYGVSNSKFDSADDDTFESFEVALLLLAHSPISSFHDEIAQCISRFLENRFSSIGIPRGVTQVDWPGIRGGIHTLHLASQLGSRECNAIMSASNRGFIQTLALCIKDDHQGQALVYALNCSTAIISLMTLEPSIHVDSIIFHMAFQSFKQLFEQLSNLERYQSSQVSNRFGECCDIIFETLLEKVDSVASHILKIDSFRYRLRLVEALVTHLIRNVRDMSIVTIVEVSALIEVLLAQNALCQDQNEGPTIITRKPTQLATGPLNSPQRVSSFNDFVSFTSRSFPEAAPIMVRLFAKLLIHGISALLSMPSESRTEMTSKSMPPPLMHNKTTLQEIESSLSDLIPVYAKCAPLLALYGVPQNTDGEVSITPTLVTSAQVSSIGALTWIVLGAAHASEIQCCKFIYTSYSQQISAIVLDRSIDDGVRASAAGFVLALCTLLRSPCALSPVFSPLFSSTELLDIVDPLSNMMDNFNISANAVVAICLQILSRYTFTTVMIDRHKSASSADTLQDNLMFDFESLSQMKDTHPPLNTAAWWSIGSRKLARLANCAYHHSLSNIKAIKDAALGLLIVLSQCFPELRNDSAWHAVLTQEILATSGLLSRSTSQPPCSLMSAHLILPDEEEKVSHGEIEMLFLSASLRQDYIWLEEVFGSMDCHKLAKLCENFKEDAVLQYFTSLFAIHPINKFDKAGLKAKNYESLRYPTLRNAQDTVPLGVYLHLPSNLDWATGLWVNDSSSYTREKNTLTRCIFHARQLMS